MILIIKSDHKKLFYKKYNKKKQQHEIISYNLFYLI